MPKCGRCLGADFTLLAAIALPVAMRRRERIVPRLPCTRCCKVNSCHDDLGRFRVK